MSDSGSILDSMGLDTVGDEVHDEFETKFEN
jgi:hypothetical protein